MQWASSRTASAGIRVFREIISIDPGAAEPKIRSTLEIFSVEELDSRIAGYTFFNLLTHLGPQGLGVPGFETAWDPVYIRLGPCTGSSFQWVFSASSGDLLHSLFVAATCKGAPMQTPKKEPKNMTGQNLGALQAPVRGRHEATKCLLCFPGVHTGRRLNI